MDVAKRPRRSNVGRVDYQFLSSGGLHIYYDSLPDRPDREAAPIPKRQRSSPSPTSAPGARAVEGGEGTRATVGKASPPDHPQARRAEPLHIDLGITLSEDVELTETNAAAFKVLVVLASAPAHAQALAEVTSQGSSQGAAHDAPAGQVRALAGACTWSR